MLNLYVVEGTSDLQKLKSLGFVYIYPLNGLQVNKEELDFLNLANKVRKIILVLDPDVAGHILTKLLQSKLTNTITIKIDKKRAIKHNKVGVAETDLEYLRYKLNNCYVFDSLNKEKETINLDDANEIYKNKDLLFKLKNKYHLRIDNLNNFYLDLNILNLNKKELL